ncbi:MAG: alpha/beta fold hydrolase [Deltaproteobacteria bacterium]|nr:alpha/beta fold hydrolase [Deltaproteobacteria bacterium]
MDTKKQSPLTPNVSNAMIRSIMVAMDIMFRATGTDVRLHGLENVPDQPVLYVANHFTRIETFIMPYIIRKHFKKFPISLADASFFTGRVGEFMNRAGGISTADPNRDAILIRALLTDSHPVIIFPEGQMIKDKKIIEKGKYLINTATGRRPPHTGAARIALRSQFIREELRLLQAQNEQAAIGRVAEHFGFDPADVGAILAKETFIVPVNITYYPVRARDNAISRLVNRFVDNVSERIEEEMEVEGAMLMDGVDIDISLGSPIAVKKYLEGGEGIREMLADTGLYLNPGELKFAPPFMKIYVQMMYEYMHAIYEMTTVNHDHLASYIITKYLKTSFSESDLKNRIYLAIDHLLHAGISRYHQTLAADQINLLTDDLHEKYENFMNDVIAENLVSRQDGMIIKNQERFHKTYAFQTIRRDNIIEVLTNEIEPLKRVTQGVDHLMRQPSAFIRQKIRNRFLMQDRQMFNEDYSQHYMAGVTKPRGIGEPFFKRLLLRNRGVILVHGYMAAPEEIEPLADFLYENGYSVYGARLRGHGTAPEDLALWDWHAWYASVNRAYIIMKNTVKAFAVVGFSTGAGLALLQAANKPGRIEGVISINGPARLQDSQAKYSRLVVLWNGFLSALGVTRGKKEFVANAPENPEINYNRNPVRGVYELERLMKYVKTRLPDVTCPVLVIQGSDDPVVNPESGMDIYMPLRSADKKLIHISADHHGILRGSESDEVKEKVLLFLKRIFR